MGSSLTVTQRWVVALASACIVLTALIAGTSVRFAYSNVELRVAIETTQALVAFLAAGLIAGRYRLTADRRDLQVSAGLVTLGLVALLLAIFATLQTVVSGPTLRSLGRWLPLGGQIVGASVIAMAALAGRRSRDEARRPWVLTVGWPLLGLAVSAAVLLAFDEHLPSPIESLAPDGAQHPTFEAHLLMQVAQALLFGAFAASAWAFAWRTEDREPDPLTRALAFGSVLAATARLTFLLYPADLIAYVHLADFFRLGFYAVLAGGAAVSIRHYWEAEVAAASLSAREGLARELHDGLAQELGFIASQTSSLASGRGDLELIDHIAMAAERARNEARRVVDALEGNAPRPLAAMVMQAVGPVAERAGATVDLRIDATLELDVRIAHEIAQLTREAMSNAVRHGHARSVVIAVTVEDDQLRLSLRDDGVGFEPGASEHRGFGLRSMEQRALQMRGNVVIRSEPGRGATVELVVPMATDVINATAGTRRSGRAPREAPRAPRARSR